MGMYPVILRSDLLGRNAKEFRVLDSEHQKIIYYPGPNPDILAVPVPDVVMTTPHYSEGYNLTRYMIMISGVYFTDQATRDQLEARINRIDSISPSIRIILIHAGIISYIHKNYEKARNLSSTLKGFAKDINLSTDDITHV